MLDVVTAVVGCSGSPIEPSPTPSDVFSPFYLNDKLAIRAEASDEQIAVLRKAWETNELSFDAVNALVEESLGCVEVAGRGVIRKAPEELGPGYLLPSYATAATAPGMSEGQVTAITAKCVDHYSQFAENALQQAPQAAQARDAQLVEDLPAMLACLNDHGVVATADETPDEIRVKVRDLLLKTHEADNGTEVLCYQDFTPQGG